MLLKSFILSEYFTVKTGYTFSAICQENYQKVQSYKN